MSSLQVIVSALQVEKELLMHVILQKRVSVEVSVRPALLSDLPKTQGGILETHVLTFRSQDCRVLKAIKTKQASIKP